MEQNAIKAGIAIDGAKLVLGAKEEHLTKYARDVLCDPDTVNAGIVLEAVKLILKGKNDSEMNNIYYSLCTLYNLPVERAIEIVNRWGKVIDMNSVEGIMEQIQKYKTSDSTNSENMDSTSFKKFVYTNRMK